MSGAIPPIPQYAFMAWCLVKHRDNFTFTLPFACIQRSEPKYAFNPNEARHFLQEKIFQSHNGPEMTIISLCMYVRGCIQKFPDCLSGARTANGTALCH
jgi:hypothetical protein